MSRSQQVTINLPTPTTWRQNHDKYKGAKSDKTFKPVTIKFSTDEHNMLIQLSDHLHCDYTNMLRQVIVSMHKELFNDVPDPGPS